MLTPYDFSIITGLRLGGERILVNDSFTSAGLRKLLGLVPSRLRSNNIPLSWLCENIPHCETTAKRARMFMLLFVGTCLCPDLGSTVNLQYLESLRRVGQIWNYDWGGMAYVTLMHFMTQISRRSFSSLSGDPFVWQVRHSLEIWRLVIDNLTINDARCEGYTECERALELNGR
ncbi:uncharacterized protein LOC142620216 [Castanea sativa]|uniref:uncharacterized protein LOC142620216 n=1 Tax=Castanea sativa TaxID=21020 RepID=UPI003F64BE59